MPYNKYLLDQLSALSSEGSLPVLVWIFNNEMSLIEDVIRAFDTQISNVSEIIDELESMGLISSCLENSHKYLVVNDLKIINILNVFSKRLLNNYEAIDMAP
jgi:histidyl-tRNA synthetase